MRRVFVLPAIVLTAAILAAGCTKANKTTNKSGRSVNISITSDGCTPNDLKMESGAATFVITNTDASDANEFEILNGSLIAGEVEGVSVGLTQTLKMSLNPGKFVIYCPGTSSERGKLTVTGKTPPQSAASRAAVNSYRKYLESQANQLEAATKQFTGAIKANDIEKAKSVFAKARYHYETVEPVAESFGDLDPRIDARVNDVAQGDTWTGFHRIEKALWQDKSLNDMSTMADKLTSDIKELSAKIRRVVLNPQQIANGSVELLNEVSSSKITGEEDRYSHTDLSDFAGNLEGSRKGFDVVKELAGAKNAPFIDQVNQRFIEAQTSLDKFRSGDSYVTYDKLTRADVQELSSRIDAIGTPLSQLAGLIVS